MGLTMAEPVAIDANCHRLLLEGRCSSARVYD